MIEIAICILIISFFLLSRKKSPVIIENKPITRLEYDEKFHSGDLPDGWCGACSFYYEGEEGCLRMYQMGIDGVDCKIEYADRCKEFSWNPTVVEPSRYISICGFRRLGDAHNS